MVSMVEIPVEIINFVNQTLIASYPPRPETSQTEHMWMLRSAGKILSEVSKVSAFALLQGLGEGLATWIADSEGAVEDCAYGLDVCVFALSDLSKFSHVRVRSLRCMRT